MITEQYVSFETSKMLKEAGFDVPCRCAYCQMLLGDYNRYQNLIGDYDASEEKNYFKSKEHYLASTQSLAARWLREVHNIDVVIIPIEDGHYTYDIFVRKQRISSSFPLKESYEAVLEFGLIMAIKLIKK